MMKVIATRDLIPSGLLGKCGYGMKPLIFSTELARSNKEITRKNIIRVSSVFKEIEELKKQIAELKKAGSKK